MGELSGGTQPQLLWRRDDTFGFHNALCAELSSLTDELANKPRNYEQVLLVGELAGALSEKHDPARALAQQCARIAMGWAHDVRAQLQPHATFEEVSYLHQKQCALYLCSAICNKAGPAVALKVEDVSVLCEAMLLAYRSRVLLPGSTGTQQLQALVARSHSVMMTRISEVDQVLSKHPRLLTAAVQAALSTVPGWLQGWSKLSTVCSCYEAVHGGCLYSVNLMTGTILMDGYPPGHLLESIRQHPLYQRCFGGADMPAVRTAQDVFHSMYSMGGRRHEFRFLARLQLAL